MRQLTAVRRIVLVGFALWNLNLFIPAEALATFPRPPSGESYRFCHSLSMDSERIRCLDIIRGARGFDKGALDACRQQNATSDQLSCLQTIKDRQYLQSETRICRAKSFSSDRRQCLQISGRDWNVALSKQAESGLNAAVDVCDRLSFSSEEDECLRIVSPAHFIDTSAVSVCAKVAFTKDKLQCLRGIIGKSFAVAETRLCADLRFDSERIRCLERGGRRPGRGHDRIARPFPPADDFRGGGNRHPSADDDIRRLTEEARRELKRRNYGEVDRILRDILAKSDRHDNRARWPSQARPPHRRPGLPPGFPAAEALRRPTGDATAIN